jgi:hypothetical protein|tara:strand:+ start:741 stop:914 length:174 start_codon:yes stop_codon:yes gene_type:complete
MTTYNLREKSNVSSGQRVTMMGVPENNNSLLESRVSQLENKLNKILNLLENKKQIKK